jgi:chemotaxis protein methyltransferase CheR
VSDEFHDLLRTIGRILDIRCESYKEDYLKRRVSSRMNATGTKRFRDYQVLILRDTEERERLRNALTINVTKFFRDPEVFDMVGKELLPEIFRLKHRARIWSAGCATGEEPYTFAIILQELHTLHPDWDGIVYATDIDSEALRKAKEGVYEKGALENISERQISRHFIARDDGKFEVRPHLRERIRFSTHDLMKDPPVSRFLDLISCRNVTIYFTEVQKDELARTFHSGLVSGGFYLIGMSEYLGREVEHLFASHRPLQKVFVRKNPG